MFANLHKELVDFVLHLRIEGNDGLNLFFPSAHQ